MKRFLLVVTTLFVVSLCFSQKLVLSKPDTTNFVFTVRTPAIEALDSYPQQITEISKSIDGYKIYLNVINPYADSMRREKIINSPYDSNRVYPHEIARYLQATPLIDYRNEGIQQIADTLLMDESDVFSLIKKALSFTFDYLTFDDALTHQIDEGICRTLDVPTILKVRKGTCSEYANLFIALMRYKNIPSRFCVGYIYSPEYNSVGTHAWPECFIEGVGWCAVDPNLNTVWFPHFMAIKMRHGLDFEDCNIRMLGLDIEPVEIEKLKKRDYRIEIA